MAHSEFVHLHVHTQYSLLDGACILERLIEKAAKFKLPALAITDHGNIYGAIKFYKLCMDKGVKPIIGCEAYIAPGSRLKKEYKPNEKTNHHLILLAKDEEGYHNLVRLVSLGHLDGFYYRPRIDKEILTQYSKGLIGLSACLKGEVASAIVAGRINDAYKIADEYLNIFGRGNFYLEVMDNGLPEQHRVNQCLVAMSKDLGIPIVCTNDVHYLEQDESFAQEVLLGIQTQTTLDDPNRFKFNSNTFYFRSPEEMQTIFKDIPGASRNTLEVTQKCNVVMDFTKLHLPHFAIPGGESEESFLRRLVFENVAKRYPAVGAEVTQRLEYELGVISKTGFSSYFIIVWDLIKFAKENNIPVGPGRGSAAGSIVSYILGITDIDPLRYDLLFERFLNPERISMPDIDIDFCYERRSRVLEYVGKKYGKDNVAQIITFGTMLARAVVRDTGRVMGFSYTDVDKIAKMIPQVPGHQITLKEAVATNPDLEAIYNSDDNIKRLIDVASKLEGLSRHASTHAAGVVISDTPLIERIPLIRGSEGEVVTGFDMESLEKTGLLKMDFLGLKTLTVIDETVKIVKRTHGTMIDIHALPFDDKKTFQLLGAGDTIGVFQLESRGMRDILNKLIPTQFEDLIAVLALYRPGPLGSGMVDDFIDRKNGKKGVTYTHPRLEPILKETYGIILYQEQTMQIVSHLAGFSLSRADLLRKAIGKKIPEIMEEQRNLFVHGCAKNAISAKIANQIFDLIDYFSGYGFNKCVTGDTKVIDAQSGGFITLQELYENRSIDFTFGFNKDFKIEKLRIMDVVANGVKSVYAVATSLGKEIEATANHPFLTIHGWKKLEDLKSGERIALPRVFPSVGKESIEPYKLIALAGIISEGNTCHPSGVYFYAANQRFFNDFVKSVKCFPHTLPTIIRRRNIFEAYCGTGRDARFLKGNIPWNKRCGVSCAEEVMIRSGFRVWLEELDLIGKKADEKFIPGFIFRLDNESLKLFVGRLWSGDGFIFSKQNTLPFYASSSHKIALSLHDLLLRFGIISKIYQKKFKYHYKGEMDIKKGYVLMVHGGVNIDNFIAHICPYIVGREKAIVHLKEYYRKVSKNKESKDTIPQEIKFTVQRLKEEKGISWRRLQGECGLSMREFVGGVHKYKKGFRRSTIKKLGIFFGSDELLSAASSEVYWDAITSIKYAGPKPTYDLQIEKYHNFIANGIVVHNSHSTAYALISYQTAYLKANFGAEFMAALLTSERNNTDKIREYVNEAGRMGIKVLPPDINTSFANFTVTDDGNIRFGLLAIKNVGGAALTSIIEVRKAAKFGGIFDFCERVDSRTVNKKVIESLIKSGAMDTFGLRRAQMAAILDGVLSRGAGKKDASQLMLFSAPKKEVVPDVAEWPLAQILNFEKTLLGMYITSHPLHAYGTLVKHIAREEIAALYEGERAGEVIVCGVLEKVKVITTRKGNDRMAIVKIEDDTAGLDVFVFPRLFEECNSFLKEKAVVLLVGKLESKEKVPKILASKVILMENIAASIKQVNITIEKNKFPLDKLRGIFVKSRGTIPVVFTLKNSKMEGIKIKTANNFFLNPSDDVLKELDALIGQENLSLTL
ncbi:MAG: DNA polymerase III subunit alpha [Candidatus Omnitrophota bacterium]|nr:DNA polymerase III subunit alpha [Candidatus Omnitrophota bacterium]